MTTKKAFLIGCKCNWIILKNIGNAINRFVRRFPWGCIIFMIMVSVIVDYIFIYQARSERDVLSLENYKMQTTIDSLKIAYDASEYRHQTTKKIQPLKYGVASINN